MNGKSQPSGKSHQRDPFRATMILSALYRFACWLYGAVSVSVFGRIMSAYDDLSDKIFSTRIAFFLKKHISTPGCTFRKIKGRLAKAYEQSILLSLLHTLSEKLLLTKTNVVGVFTCTAGVSTILVQLLTKYTFRLTELSVNTLAFGGTMIVLSIPLFFSDKTIAYSIRDSRILNFLLSDFLKINPVGLNACAKARPRLGFSVEFMFGILLGAIIAIVDLPIILALLAVVVLAVLTFSSPETGIILIFTLLPFLKTMHLVAMLCLIMLSFFLKAICGRRVLRFSLIDFPIIGFLIFTISGGIFTIDSSSFSKMLVMVCFTCGYFLVKNIVRSPQLVYRCLYALTVSSVGVSLYGLYQNFFGSLSSIWQDMSLFSDIRGRAVSTFENPNVLGEYLILIFPIILALMLTTKKHNERFIFLVAAVLDGACLVFTWSRGAWLGILIALLLFLLLYDKRVFAVGILVAPVALLVLMFFGADTALVRRFTSIGNLTDSSTSYRLNIWRGTLIMLADVFYFGIGIGEGTFRSLYPLYSFPGIETAPHSHNLYLQILTETGIVSLCLFLLTFFFFAQCSFTFFRKANDKANRIICIGIFCGVLAFLLQGVTDYVFYNYRIILLFWMMLGLGIAHIDTAKTTPEEIPNPYI